MTEGKGNATGLVPAFVLHARKYRDTSALLEILTREGGRQGAVIRGVYGARRSRAGLVQPFQPLLVQLTGGGELKTARNLEAAGSAISLEGEALLLGLYINELLYRTLGRFEPVPEVFDAYPELLLRLALGNEPHAALRGFELLLLEALGYGIVFDQDAGDGQPVVAGQNYRFVAEKGFVACAEDEADVIAGASLLMISGGNLGGENDAIIKRVVRRALAPLLGGRPLQSRALFGNAR